MTTQTNRYPDGVQVTRADAPDYAEILSYDALRFLADLERTFRRARATLLQKRAERQAHIDAGKQPNFLPETEHIRRGAWTVSPVPADLQDRRVEITGPSGDRKIVINALNSGARVFMADFEDANSPTWDN